MLGRLAGVDRAAQNLPFAGQGAKYLTVAEDGKMLAAKNARRPVCSFF